MTSHKCTKESKIKSIGAVQYVILGLIAVFLTLVGFSASKADKAAEKADKAIEKAAEIAVIKNDVQWIKKHLETRSKTP